MDLPKHFRSFLFSLCRDLLDGNRLEFQPMAIELGVAN